MVPNPISPRKRTMKNPNFPNRPPACRIRAFLPWVGLLLGLGFLFLACVSGEPRIAPVVMEHVPESPAVAEAAPFAGEPVLRVKTLNLAHGRKDGFSQALQGRRKIMGNLDEIAAVLRRESPEIVALQEADGPSVWSGRFNHVALLAESAGYGYSIQGAHVAGAGLSYGTAILARHPIETPLSVTFEPSPPTFPKGFVVGTVRIPGRNSGEPDWPVDVVSVHLDFSRASVRRKQALEMVRLLSEREVPLVVMGDFNSQWSDRDSALRILADGLGLRTWRESEAEGLETFPLTGKRLDWILISPELEFRDYRVLPDVLSDHLGVAAAIAPKTPNRARAGATPGSDPVL